MAITYDATVQNQIALRLINQTYANAQSTDKTVIDNNWTTGDPGGHAGDALTLLRQYANFIELDGSGSSDGPAVWSGWLIAETVYRAAIHLAPDREPAYRRLRDSAAQAAMSAYSREDTDTITSTEGLAYSRINLRRRVLAKCIALNPMLMARPEQIDQCITDAVSRIYETKQWSWRRISETITFANASTTNPTPTYGTAATPEAIFTSRLYFSSPTTSVGKSMVYATEDQIQRMIASGLDAGQPQHFNIQTTAAGGLSWYIDRTTDQQYVVRAVVLKAKPDLSVAGGVDTALGQMPYETRSVVYKLALANTLIEHGRTAQGFPMLEVAERDLDRLWTSDDPGNPDASAAGPTPPAQFAQTMLGHQWGETTIGGNL